MSLKTALLFVFLAVGSAPARADVFGTSGAGLADLLGKQTPIIDIRRPEEWRQTGVIAGSHLMTFFDAQGRYDARAWIAKLGTIVAPDEPFILVCETGGRTGLVSRFLSQQAGYQKVFDVQGGIARWIREGHPTVPP